MLRDCWVELAAYIRNRLDPHEHHEVEAFMQEAAVDFKRDWEEIGPPRNRNEAIARLKASAKGDLFNHRAKLDRRRTEPYAIDDDVLLNAANPEADDDFLALIGRLDCERLRLTELLPQLLTERQRAVIAAVAIDGLSTADVAAQMGITQRAVQDHLAKARERLLRHLELQPTQGTTRENPS
ncbi:sigma-70 family RNA polymerase sigma factor [Lentzea sp. NPDC051838]|uniref:RNA polymerase sigma factor n=1 Tax=Lentzea sp. NPDC051838 TaxID=3154849 RepID=UPI00342B035E